MKITIEPATRSNFAPYGQLIEMPVPEAPTIAVETVNFWKQQAIFSIEGKTQVGVLKVKKHDMRFDQLENHFKTVTGMICLDSDCVIAVAEPSDEVPKASAIKAFQVPKAQLMVLAEKCWHSITYPIDKDEITLLVIFHNDALDDDTVFEDLDEQVELSF